MAVESSPTVLGTLLPERSLPDASGSLHEVRQKGSQATLIAFVCNHCPYVQHIESALADTVARYLPEGLRLLAVVSNDTLTHPGDGPDGMAEQVARAGWDFPYLIDADQSFARELGAVCTPDFFLYNQSFALAYRGAFDSSSPKNGNPVTGDLLEGALRLVLGNNDVPEPHRPAMGCGIKWLEAP